MSGSYYDFLALESRAYDIAHWIAMEARVAESMDRSVAPIEIEGARRIVALASARRALVASDDLRDEIARILCEVAQEAHDDAPHVGPGPMYVPSDFGGHAARILALLRTPRGERPAGPLDAAEWADLDEAVPLPEPLTDAERAEGLARIRADRMRRTPRGEGEAEALAAEILAELRRAREKFPGDNVTTLALVEEVGELAKATFEESRDRVREEAVQVAAMAMRVVLDGDQTLDAWRESKGLDPLTAARRGEGGGDG